MVIYIYNTAGILYLFQIYLKILLEYSEILKLWVCWNIQSHDSEIRKKTLPQISSHHMSEWELLPENIIHF